MNTNVECVIYSLGQMEFGGKPIPATDELEKRLNELAEGRRVPLVTFNCLETSWRPNARRYPQTFFIPNVDQAVCKYNLDAIEVIRLEVQRIGEPDLKVAVPDSELTDARVFSFAQSDNERLTIAQTFRDELVQALAGLNSPQTPVTLWSEYCQIQGLRRRPAEYTAENYDRLQRNPQLMQKVQGQVKDSKRYFERNRLFRDYINNIREDEMLERVSWYLAMYMGEGQALSESRAIALNLEDGRVPAWFQRGAYGKLPILTPVDATEFYRWRAAKQSDPSDANK